MKLTIESKEGYLADVQEMTDAMNQLADAAKRASDKTERLNAIRKSGEVPTGELVYKPKSDLAPIAEELVVYLKGKRLPIWQAKEALCGCRWG